MKLPYLKNKLPRVAPEPASEKLVNASSADHVADHCAGELMESVQKKDVKGFRQALEALCLNLFDWDSNDES